MKKTIKNLLGKFSNNVTWIGGHRPVENNFSLRQSGLFVQIHNPDKMNVVYIDSNRSFNFETDFISLD